MVCLNPLPFSTIFEPVVVETAVDFVCFLIVLVKIATLAKHQQKREWQLCEQGWQPGLNRVGTGTHCFYYQGPATRRAFFRRSTMLATPTTSARVHLDGCACRRPRCSTLSRTLRIVRVHQINIFQSFLVYRIMYTAEEIMDDVSPQQRLATRFR
eukprot:5912423-Amphidinium_carterae.1